jgi:hypothetical protein
MRCGECNGRGWFYSDNGPAPRTVECADCDGAGEWEDPIPTVRRYHADPQFRAECDRQKQDHYDRFYAGTSAAIDRANPRTHWEQEQ